VGVRFDFVKLLAGKNLQNVFNLGDCRTFRNKRSSNNCSCVKGIGGGGDLNLLGGKKAIIRKLNWKSEKKRKNLG